MSKLKTQIKQLSWREIPYRWVHVAAVVLIYVFCTWMYGDVFQRAQQNCYVTTSAEQMVFLRHLDGGNIYWGLRFLMLPFKNLWLGGAWLTMWLVGSACLLSHALRLTRRWKLVTFVLPILTLCYFVWRGIRIYYHDEPSIIIGLPIAVVLLTGIAALVGHFACKKPAAEKHAHPVSIAIVAVAFAALFVGTDRFRQNDVLTASMQNKMWEADWDGIVDDALSARQGNRTIAAYYAIALVQQDKLLEKLFDLPFDYPLDNTYLNHNGKTEYALFETDCNFYAGLINSSYRAAMESHVMSGATIYNYKRMALAAIIMGEKNLAERYLFALESVPFEQAFVEEYRPMLINPQLVQNDPELKKVVELLPIEENLEQNYRRPVFMGYNVGLGQGNDPTLKTSAAATLYSKDIMRLLNVASVMRHKFGRLPRVVKEAILIKSLTLKEVENVFPEVTKDAMLLTNFQTFVKEARPYLDDKPKLREVMREKWLGTYFYYYYCENNHPNQVRPANASSAGVN